MKIRNFRRLILIGSVALVVIFNGCSEDEGPTPDNPDYSMDSGEFRDVRDDKIYNWVKIDTQIWMAENLNYTGNDIQSITDNDEWAGNTNLDGWCYYDNNSDYADTFGVLYQWEAAKKVCPEGWHLPTHDEWETLVESIGGKSVAGGKMKVPGTEHWNSPNEGADNSSGFSGLPGGYRKGFDGMFDKIGTDGLWWSSTETNINYAYVHTLLYNNSSFIYHEYGNKLIGFSVRCVKD